MKNTKYFLASILLTSFLCFNCAPTLEQMNLEVQGYKLPQTIENQDCSLIYVARPYSVGTLIRFNVFLDNKESTSEVGYTRGNQYIYFFVNPGKHTIFSKAENWAEISVDIKPAETIFLKQIVSMGVIMARNSLVQVQDIEGKYNVKNTSIGTVINPNSCKITKSLNQKEITW